MSDVIPVNFVTLSANLRRFGSTGQLAPAEQTTLQDAYDDYAELGAALSGALHFVEAAAGVRAELAARIIRMGGEI